MCACGLTWLVINLDATQLSIVLQQVPPLIFTFGAAFDFCIENGRLDLIRIKPPAALIFPGWAYSSGQKVLAGRGFFLL